MELPMSHLRLALPWSLLSGLLGCGADSGSVQGPESFTDASVTVTVTTLGDEQDPDGYELLLDGNLVQRLRTNAEATVSITAERTHSLELGDIAPNCRVADRPGQAFTNPIILQGRADQRLKEPFTVFCLPETAGGIYFQTDFVPGVGIFSAWMWGTGGRTVGVTEGTQIAVSREGNRIAFVRLDMATGCRELFTADADGGNEVQLTDSPDVAEENPSWSPDGAKIVFHRTERPLANCAFGSRTDSEPGLWMVDADGGGLTSLGVVDGRDPDWSPSGDKIAFGKDGSIWIMNPDGTDVEEIVPGTANSSPAWSPDGEWIAFTQSQVCDASGEIVMWGSNLVKVNLSTGARTEVSPAQGCLMQARPSWSPDGRWIVFDQESPPRGIYVRRAEGSDLVPLFIGDQTDWPFWASGRL